MRITEFFSLLSNQLTAFGLNPFTTIRGRRFLKQVPATDEISSLTKPKAPLIKPPLTPTKLDIARGKLKDIDVKIAAALKKFRAAKNQNINPTTEMVRAVKFPNEIIVLSTLRDTPIELFAGVAQFLALNIDENGIKAKRKMDKATDKLDEFIALGNLLCDRHEASRLVVEHKSDNADEFRGDDGKVITFIEDQHYNVVVARITHNSIAIDADYELSATIIDWVAAVNAGWQDMAINDNTGPFINPVQADSRHEIRDPRPATRKFG